MDGRLVTAFALAVLVLAVSHGGFAQQHSRGADAATADSHGPVTKLEREVAQLQRELRARRLDDVQDAKEWQANYQKTRDRILKLQSFVNRYALFE